MVSFDDVRELALELPESKETTSYGTRVQGTQENVRSYA